jgi:hypothetical protein
MKSMPRALLTIVLSAWTVLAFADYGAAAAHGSDLSGNWVLNAALSEDPERLLNERLEKERSKYAQWRRQEDMMRPPGVPRIPDADDDGETSATSRPPRQQRPWQKQRDENFRRMLGITKTLSIRQSGAQLEIISALDTRRLIAGSHTQVSMPEGQLADSEVGWDGEWFVIERSVRKGPRVIEKLRLVRKTGQLEYTMAWSGDTELSGIKVRRVFERMTGEPPPPDPTSGPIR